MSLKCDALRTELLNVTMKLRGNTKDNNNDEDVTEGVTWTLQFH